MGPIDLSIHLLSFLAPALAVGALVAAAARVFMPGQAQDRSWWAQAAINFIVGVAVSAAGLWYWGVDGKMATYAALALAVATCQWASSRAWRA